MFARPSTNTIPATLTFRQLPAAITSRAATAAKTMRNAASIAAAGIRPMTAETNTAARPAAQRPASAASAKLATGGLPVQFGIAVNRNPARTAQTPAAKKNGRKPRLRKARPRRARACAAAPRPGPSKICVISLEEPAARPGDRAKNGYRAKRQQDKMHAKNPRQHPVRIARRLAHDPLMRERFGHEDHRHEECPDNDHGVHPPERRVAEPRPEVEPKRHPKSGETGEQNGEPHLPGEALLDRFEQRPSLAPAGGARERQPDQRHERDAADPVDDEQDMQRPREHNIIDGQHALSLRRGHPLSP